MPFSSGCSVRAPASKATRMVVARVPGRPTRCSGRPLGRVSLWIWGIGVRAERYLAAANRLARRTFARGYSARRMATMEVDPRLERRFERAPTGPAVIEFRGVSKNYEGGDVGLDGATLAVTRSPVPRGDFVSLVGAPGSGKSTIMKLLLKEHEPSQGTIRVAG